jgi:hypothetical protein
MSKKEYLMDTATAFIESHRESERLTTISVVENPNATKYKYEMYVYDNSRCDDETLDEVISQSDVHYGESAVEIYAQAFLEIVAVESGVGVKILSKIAEIE